MTTDRDPQTRFPPLQADHTWRTLILSVLVLALAACATLRSPSPDPSPASTLRPTHTIHPITPTADVTEEPSEPTSTARPGTPTTQPPSTILPSPTPAPATGTPEPTIHTFTANVDIADPGETITMTWHWSGADGAAIYHLWPTGQLTEPYWEIGPTGSLQYTIGPERRNSDLFVLYLIDSDEGVVAQQSLRIALRCPDEWFFEPAPDICPAGPATFTDAAEQRFERGIMVWSGADGVIYILFDDEHHSRWHMTSDRWEEGDPPSDPEIVPPSGLYQPIRGFGLIWREHPTVRERLGWAVAVEQGYQGAIQSTSHARYRDIYIRALDGGVWRLRPNGSAWEHLETARE